MMRETAATGVIDKTMGEEAVKADLLRVAGYLVYLEEISEEALARMLFVDNQCPDCGRFHPSTHRFLKGPEGGLCVNIKCADCGSEFNVSPPWFAERIGVKDCNQCGRTIREADADANGICPECAKQNQQDREKITQYIKDGHTEHCAARLVWGDGECECKAFPEKRNPMELAKAIRQLQKKNEVNK